jgi:hypothetical protein
MSKSPLSPVSPLSPLSPWHHSSPRQSDRSRSSGEV